MTATGLFSAAVGHIPQALRRRAPMAVRREVAHG